MKAIARLCDDVAAFPPGHCYDSSNGECVRYYTRRWRDYDAVVGIEVSAQELREAFEAAVHRQMMSDVPYGVLLSGGAGFVAGSRLRRALRSASHRRK
jgi:asparagine synthase (glutamine-hydrolysing)